MLAVTLSAQLEAFEDRLRSLDAPVVRHLGPGLARAEIEVLLGDFCRSVPDDVADWFAWHHGIVSATRWADQALIGGYWPYRIDQALSASDGLRRHGPEELQDLSGVWLPLMTDSVSKQLCIDVSPGQPGTVMLWDHQNDERPVRMVAPSLSDVVERWIQLIDAGFHWDEERGSWRLSLDSRDSITIEALREAAII